MHCVICALCHVRCVWSSQAGLPWIALAMGTMPSSLSGLFASLSDFTELLAPMRAAMTMPEATESCWGREGAREGLREEGEGTG